MASEHRGPVHKVITTLSTTLSFETGEVLEEEAPEWEIEHPQECHELLYGERCDLDWAIEEYGTDQMPDEVGEYSVWVWWEHPVPGADAEYDIQLGWKEYS